jgi:hypothetical protein
MDKNDEQKQLLIDYKGCFATEAGMRVLADLAKLANLDHSVKRLDNQGRLDPFAMMRDEGQRSVVRHIYSKVNKDPYQPKQKKAKG